MSMRDKNTIVPENMHTIHALMERFLAFIPSQKFHYKTAYNLG